MLFTSLEFLFHERVTQLDRINFSPLIFNRTIRVLSTPAMSSQNQLILISFVL